MAKVASKSQLRSCDSGRKWITATTSNSRQETATATISYGPATSRDLAFPQTCRGKREQRIARRAINVENSLVFNFSLTCQHVRECARETCGGRSADTSIACTQCTRYVVNDG